MPRLLSFLLLILWSARASGQDFREDFTDREIFRNPAWQGNTDHFIASRQELQLESPAPGRSYISTLCLLRDTARWRIRMQLNFQPSALNQALFVLSSDIPDLNGPWTGWALRIGNNGVNDGLDLLRVRRGDRTTAATFFPASMLHYPEVTVSILRTRAGEWQCLADTNNSGRLLWAGSHRSTEPLEGSYLGILCHYTSSNLEKFFFDNIEAGPLYPDLVPPIPMAAKAYPNRIRIDFNEAILPPLPGNFHLAPGAWQPDSMRLVGKTLWLYFHPNLEPARLYRLSGNGIRDASGNETSFTLPVKYLLPAEPGTLALSEVKPGGRKLAGASPSAEFVEIRNLTETPLSLDSVVLIDRSGAYARLPDDSIAAGGYRLLCRPADAAQFAAYPNLLRCSLPALNDDGDSLVLVSAAGDVLDAMGYAPESFDEPLNRYTHSLECRTAQRDCLPPALLWLETRSDTGSTPGLPNSVEQLPVSEGMAVLFWEMKGARTLALRLNRNAEPGRDFRASMACPAEPGFAAGGIVPQSQAGDRSRLVLSWNGDALSTGKTYRLEITGLQGCRPGQETILLDFGLPLPADSGRASINEVMFEPAPGGAEWVELINPSPTDWLSLHGASLGAWPGALPDSLMLSGLFAPLPPGGIVWLSRSRRQARNAHPQAPMGNFAQAALPELYSQEGDLSLRAANGRLVEAVRYSRKRHHPLLAQTKGVSLERTSPAVPTGMDGAFVSAARSAGFCTPGMPNSAAAGGEGGEESFSASPAAFSPDLDGRNDYCNLALSLPGSAGEAWFYTIRIFDGEGRPVRTLADNLSGTGRVEHIWDGTDQNRARAPSGPYIALAEFFTLSGRKGRAKCGLAVAPW